MKITLDGTPKEIAQILQVLQVKQPQITTGAIAAEKLEDSITKGIRPYNAEAIPVSCSRPSAKLDSYGVTTNRIADHGITYDRLSDRQTEEEQR